MSFTLKLKRVTSAYSKRTVQILFAMEVIKKNETKLIASIIQTHKRLERIFSLPICEISPLCLNLKPSSRVSSFDKPFHKVDHSCEHR